MPAAAIPGREPDLASARRQTIELLHREFATVHTLEHVTEVVEVTYTRISAGARAMDFVPLLAKRFARESLLAELPGHGIPFLHAEHDPPAHA